MSEGESTAAERGPAWFDCEDGDPKAKTNAVAVALVSQVNMIENGPLETSRRDNLLYDLELYFGTKLESLYAAGDGNVTRFWQPDAILFNICYSITNTIRNRICSFRPRAQFIPNGGNLAAERGAEDMTNMCDAWAVETKYQAQASLMFRDLLTCDGGVLKAYEEDDKVKCNRFPPWEFYFDQAESIYDEPECAYHVSYITLEQAAAKYGIEENILVASTVSAPAGIIYIQNRQMVRQIEAWRRAHGEYPKELGEDATPEDKESHAKAAKHFTMGRHTLTVGEQLVSDDDWKYDGFPLIKRVFDENAVGTWGTGPVRMLRADQLELIKEQETLRRAHEGSSTTIVQVQDGEDGPTKVSNEWVRIERYKNAPAIINTPPAVNQERYQYVDLIWKKAYDKIGISQFLAAGTKQPGTTSAVAIDASSEMQSDRLALCSQIWESMAPEAATWWWRLTRDMAKRDGQTKPKFRSVSNGVWRDLVFEDLVSEWEIRPFPSSIFGQTVSGRLNKAMQAVQAGWIERDDALRAIDVPDLKPITDLILAPKLYMEALVDNILERNKFDRPEPYIKPEDMQSYAVKRYLLAACSKSNYPEANMATLRRLIDSLSPPPAPVPAAPAMTPVAQAIPGQPIAAEPVTATQANEMNGAPPSAMPPS